MSIVLRLYPSVPVNTRSPIKATTLPVGGGPDGKSPILVRKGEAVGYCVYAMHRRKDIYGEDADNFRPSRWEGDELKNLGWAYLPFNGGPRICLGRKFYLFARSWLLILARIMYRLMTSRRVCAPRSRIYCDENASDVQKDRKTENSSLEPWPYADPCRC